MIAPSDAYDAKHCGPRPCLGKWSSRLLPIVASTESLAATSRIRR